MYQKVNNQVKYIVLRENVRALNQGLNDEAQASQSAILAFGLNPKKKCDDFKFSKIKTNDLSKTVDGYLPGAFSKTPLGESIRRGTDIAIENKVEKIIIFSDGADSCDKDPCQELIKSNDKLTSTGYKMNIKFIGINLKKNDPKFECFRNNKLSNINIDFSNIGDSFDVQNALQDAAQGAASISLQNVRSPWGIIKVKGAPPTVKFKATAKRADIQNGGRQNWFGAYTNQLKSGEYLISANYPGAKKIPLMIQAEQERELLWGDFFKDEKSKLSYTRSTFSVLLEPAAGTIEAHRSVGPILIEGLLEEAAQRDQKISFGDWNVIPVSPPWLKDIIGQKNITLKPESSLKVNFFELLDLEWVKNPDSKQQWVISIEEPPKQKEEDDELSESVSQTATVSAPAFYVRPPDPSEDAKLYFIQTGVESIPIPRGAKVNWIKSNFQ
jgi:hypothetical protein